MLSAIDPAASRPPTIRDVVIFKTLPNDLATSRGVISATPQTPLSHINLKAKQNDTPNAYVKRRVERPADRAAASARSCATRSRPTTSSSHAATPEQVEAWLERIRPAQPQTPPRDLDGDGDRATSTSSATATSSASARRPRTSPSCARCCRPARCRTASRSRSRFYDEFMTANGFYDAAREMIADPDVRGRPGGARRRRSTTLRKQIKKADRPARARRARSPTLQAKFPAGHGDPLPLLDEQRGPRGLQRRRPLRLVHAPRRRGRPGEDRQAGLGVAVELPRVRRARVPSHRPPERRDGRAVSPELRRRARQRRRGDEEHLRPELAGLLRQRPGRRERS